MSILTQKATNYSRSKPLTIGEFDLEKAWWGGAARKGRKVTEYAWKVSAEKLAERNYNLDFKNPYKVEEAPQDLEDLNDYQVIMRQLEAAQKALKEELIACLGAKV